MIGYTKYVVVVGFLIYIIVVEGQFSGQQLPSNMADEFRFSGNLAPTFELKSRGMFNYITVLFV